MVFNHPGTTIVHTADKRNPDLWLVAFFGRCAAALLEKAGLDEEHLIFHYDKGMIFWKPASRQLFTMRAEPAKHRLYYRLFLPVLAGRLIELHEEKKRKNLTSSAFPALTTLSSISGGISAPDHNRKPGKTTCGWTPPRSTAYSRKIPASPHSASSPACGWIRLQ